MMKRLMMLAAIAAIGASTVTAAPALAGEGGNTYLVEADDHYYVRRGGNPPEWGCIQHDGKLLVSREGGQLRVRCGEGDGKYPPSRPPQPRAPEGETVWLAYRGQAWFSPGEGVRKLKTAREFGTVHVYAGKSR